MRHTDLWFSRIDRGSIVELGAARSGPCLSAFFPVPARSDARNRTFDAVYDQVSSALKANLPTGLAAAILRGVGSVLAAPKSWRPACESLAVYSSGDTFAVVAASLKLPHSVQIAPRFLTRPLLRGLAEEPRYDRRALLGKSIDQLPGRRTVTGIAEILQAAARGEVRYLLLTEDGVARGRADPGTGEVLETTTPGPEDDDLLDLAAVKTLETGGQVGVARRGQLATRGSIVIAVVAEGH
ncbi:MAG: hypothetical protein FJ314_05495 [SAR202 cluster bacterium]|nr:hypothetical protein [SAR202 cluster bacterium]